MKNAAKSSKTEKTIDLFISNFSDAEILNTEGMSNVRGGEGDGSVPIIIIPEFNV